MEAITTETDAAPLSGSSFYFAAAADVAAIAASDSATITDADVKALSGFYYFSASAATAIPSDADANFRNLFFSPCLKSRL